MVEVNYHGISVQWEDREYEILQEIKQRHFEDPDWKPPNRGDVSEACARVGTTISPTFHAAIMGYADKTGRSVASVLRDVIAVLVE